MAFTEISLCAGYGGLTMGLKRAFGDVRTVCYVENEIFAAGILASRIAEGRLDRAPIYTDLKTFDPEPWRGIDIISGGYPCQPFSVAGKRKGAEDPRHLWPYIARIVSEIQPKICVFENVRGHVRLGLSEVLGELRGLGYRVRAGIFAASEVGAPHRRERVFILAHRDGIGHRAKPGEIEYEGRQTEITKQREERNKEIRERMRSVAGDGGSDLAHFPVGGSGTCSGLEHSQSIPKREQNNKTSTESREESRQMPGGRRSALENTLRDRRRGRRDGHGKAKNQN